MQENFSIGFGPQNWLRQPREIFWVPWQMRFTGKTARLVLAIVAPLASRQPSHLRLPEGGDRAACQQETRQFGFGDIRILPLHCLHIVLAATAGHEEKLTSSTRPASITRP